MRNGEILEVFKSLSEGRVKCVRDRRNTLLSATIAQKQRLKTHVFITNRNLFRRDWKLGCPGKTGERQV